MRGLHTSNHQEETSHDDSATEKSGQADLPTAQEVEKAGASKEMHLEGVAKTLRRATGLNAGQAGPRTAADGQMRDAHHAPSTAMTAAPRATIATRGPRKTTDPVAAETTIVQTATSPLAPHPVTAPPTPFHTPPRRPSSSTATPPSLPPSAQTVAKCTSSTSTAVV